MNGKLSAAVRPPAEQGGAEEDGQQPGAIRHPRQCFLGGCMGTARCVEPRQEEGRGAVLGRGNVLTDDRLLTALAPDPTAATAVRAAPVGRDRRPLWSDTPP